jgi:thiol-disulfide isomerase/thioredoxin
MQRRRVSLPRVAFGAAVGGTALWLLTFGSFDPPARLSAPGGYRLADFRFPVVNRALFDGDTTFVTSADLRGSVALVTFWATWCAPCIAEQPSLLALQHELADEEFRLLAVLHKDSPQAALEWLQESGRLDLTTVVGTREFVSAARGGLPVTLLVDRDGMVVEAFLGYWPERDPYVRERVRALLDA